jgi:branched-chain amino acid transport system permease protein
MDVFAVSILVGISYGFVLFLISAGLSLVLGLMGIVNVAHGALFMTGAYFGVTVAKASGSLLLGVLCGAVLAGIVGFVIERGFLRVLYKQELEQILVTFGFMYIISNLHLWIYGGWPLAAFVPQFLRRSISIGRFGFPYHRLAVIGFGALVCVLMWWMQEKTKLGSIVRAGMDDSEMVSAMGINITPINVGAFCLGALLAGLAGVVGAPILGGVDLNISTNVFFLAIAVCIIGGVGSVQGALAGALLLGIISTLVRTYLPVMAIFVMYILMVLILIIKPAGLYGRE